MESELRQSTIQKAYSVKQITFKTDKTARNDAKQFNVNLTSPPKGGYPNNTDGNFKRIQKNFD